jgi:hypothetical protein
MFGLVMNRTVRHACHRAMSIRQRWMRLKPGSADAVCGAMAAKKIGRNANPTPTGGVQYRRAKALLEGAGVERKSAWRQARFLQRSEIMTGMPATCPKRKKSRSFCEGQFRTMCVKRMQAPMIPGRVIWRRDGSSTLPVLKMAKSQVLLPLSSTNASVRHHETHSMCANP